MAIANLPRPINRGSSGYQSTQEIPITAGGTPAPRGSTDDFEDPEDAPINEWLKAQPWFQEALRQWGINPNNVHLNNDQRFRIADAARRAGLNFGSSHDIGPGGDWEDTHTTAARNIGLAIAGVAGGVGALGATGALGGAEAGTLGAATTVPEVGALGAGTLASSTIAPALGSLPAVAASGAVPAAMGVGEAAALTGTAAGGIGDAVASGALPSSQVAPALGTLPAVAPSGVVPAAMTPAVASAVPSTVSRIAQLANPAAKAISAATQSAGETQLTNANLGVQANNSNISANNSNISGQQSFEQELMNRAKLESDQRKNALANIYRASYTKNPSVSPYNIAGPTKYSQDYLDALDSVSREGQNQLKTPQQYAANGLPPLTPYTPYRTDFKPDTDPSTMQTVGNWLAPTLSTIGTVADLYGKWGG